MLTKKTKIQTDMTHPHWFSSAPPPTRIPATVVSFSAIYVVDDYGCFLVVKYVGWDLWLSISGIFSDHSGWRGSYFFRLLFHGCLGQRTASCQLFIAWVMLPHQWLTSHSVSYTGSRGSPLDSLLYPWLPNLEKEWCKSATQDWGLVKGCCLLPSMHAQNRLLDR